MNLKIICNEKGTGKTTYAMQKYRPNLIYENNCIQSLNEYNCMNDFFYIIDSIQDIPEMIFSDLLNYIISFEWKGIILIFDIPKEGLSQCSNFNNLWAAGLIPKNYMFKNFVANKEIFYDYIKKYYPQQNSENYNNLIEITNYNFDNLDRLMLLNNLQRDSSEVLNTKAISQYIEEAIQKTYGDIPDADILLQKASVIGEKFTCDALESPDGFGLNTASLYMKQMGEMHTFIKKCFDQESIYEFISRDIYIGVYDNISSENKLSWAKILIQYYQSKYNHCTDLSKKIKILVKLNNIYTLIPSKINERKSVCFLLFYLYRKNNQIYYAIQIAKTILYELYDAINSVEYAYIQNYLIYELMQLGEYKNALEILKKICDNEEYCGSKMIIKYYYAYCLYQTGDIDFAYSLIIELKNYLKSTSGSNSHKQELFCKTYSLMATLQNHLKDGDSGFRYYKLALNHAIKLENHETFFEIQKKCDMFYSFEQNKEILEKCILFYEENKNWSLAGEVYVNLATEMLFQDCSDASKIKLYFQKAINYFEENKSKKKCYAQNNYAIYLAIVENDIERAIYNFNKALLVGLSDFTYMTIYLNICVCYILLNQITCDEFEDAYNKFKFVKKRLNKRKSSTQYEDMYEIILDIIIKEHIGEDTDNLCNKALNMLEFDSFFEPILRDIINRNHENSGSCYKDNCYFYHRINSLKCFFAEFRFWE